jgi:AcrR family transcriptional regulator
MRIARRSFRRQSEDRRRHDLVEATLDCIAEQGLAGATVRAIALRAGVTAGLIRHYFPGKQELLQAAYRTTITRMTEQALAALTNAPAVPQARLMTFIQASLKPPVVDSRSFTLWAAFISRVHTDPAFAAVHQEGYLGFRDQVEALVANALAAVGRSVSRSELRRYAIAVNAVVDGLWLEGCLAGEMFESGELAEIGVVAVEALLDLPLHPVRCPAQADPQDHTASLSPMAEAASEIRRRR